MFEFEGFEFCNSFEMLITKKFRFESAHFLPNYHGKCENMHGHSYRLEVTFEGEPKEDGMIIDFARMKKIVVEKVIDRLDHVLINDIIENPSAENMAIWIWKELESEVSEGVKIYEILVGETETSEVRYRG